MSTSRQELKDKGFSQEVQTIPVYVPRACGCARAKSAVCKQMCVIDEGAGKAQRKFIDTLVINFFQVQTEKNKLPRLLCRGLQTRITIPLSGCTTGERRGESHRAGPSASSAPG